MSYELWDTETGNLVEVFDNETDALQATRDLIAVNADVYPAMLALLSVGRRGELATVAAGDDLGRLVTSEPNEGARRAR